MDLVKSLNSKWTLSDSTIKVDIVVPMNVTVTYSTAGTKNTTSVSLPTGTAPHNITRIESKIYAVSSGDSFQLEISQNYDGTNKKKPCLVIDVP